MTSQTSRIRWSVLVKCVFLVGLLLAFSAQVSNELRTGSVRCVVMANGSPLAGAVVELCLGPDLQSRYQGVSSKLGAIQIENVPPGDYLLRIRAPGRVMTTGPTVKVTVGHESDAGVVVAGPLSCIQLGSCDDPMLDATYKLPCAKGVVLMRNSLGAIVGLSSDELKEQAVNRVDPDWPRDARPGHIVTIGVIIGQNGSVLCASAPTIRHPSANRQRSASEEAAVLKAAAKWQFKPILKDGVPVCVMGELEFRVPGKSEL